ncbi:hypothetical protein FOPG_16429 [Fusarium oxysporum f. sp. conglutinans race 2 54008]|jgi:hypothetical protein|uniref:Fatty acid hydroxylase domain-containing protein n=6 Tax=Fusarium oxysporum TaxID=5507 RepID=A0A0J9VMU3_FUSO4|nr:hypothetical protein FOXG_11682 [Fusarium oxysporum f. sp. lycopersici 4287]EGU76916.1 hypothetical protein FOXB_12581 [Fusarium oxysporum f. sp. conglutinans Fo5176]EXK29806.1 hypothetical protein FOMG_14235 [Fusarium oxysporum f. sp. melonis 26406]EXL67452.1 hypothetical protein FOPG_16429 [Fusarium oxysporum f. sp. conglutinans race 2 54008]KAG6998914.1 hypothetical protein FocnCong_v014593 [Fusarium oxysporum f. sp. conglutinans]KAI8406885.1 hypothetical protein FOFC_12308 [Fusarium oxy
MDVLLSLPIISYLLSPASASWSTSLNIFFFYVQWTTFVLTHTPFRVRLIGSLATRIILFLIPSLVSLLFDTGVPSIAESIKFGGRASLAPRDARLLTRQLGLVLVNLLCVTLLEGASHLAFRYVVGENDFNPTALLPLPWQLAKHLVLMMTGREVLTYYIHRNLLHSSGAIGRLHKRFSHARSAAPYSLLVFADHPIPFLLHHFFPMYLPAIALRPHMVTYFLFLALCTVEETITTSGYSVVPGIIMGGMTRRRAIHYASGGDCNFGAWGVLDWANDTGRGRDVLDDVRAEAEKHNVKERSADKLDSGVSALQGGIDKLTNGDDGGKRRSSRLRSKRAGN